MKAIDRELLSVLSDKTIRFVVPVYQRSYAWREEHWERLWNDIMAIAQRDSYEHFTGSIVWVGNMQGPGTGTEGNVLVDGQQRLTTLSLAILAYAEFAKEHDNKASNGEALPVTYKKILGSGYLLSDYEEGDQRYKITLSDVDEKVFRALVESLVTPSTIIPDTESPLVVALDYFRAKISGLEDQSVFWRGIERLRIVNVTLDPSRDNPQLVFERMNSTGKSLCHADLIRNYILLGLPFKKQSEFYRNYWRPIELLLGTDKDMSGFDQFIFHYLTLYTAPNIVNQSEIYQQFKNYKYSSGLATEELLREMLFYAQIYASITRKGFEKDTKIGTILHNIETLKASPIVPLIMLFYARCKLHPEEISREEFLAAIKIIEVYLVYRTLCDYRNNSLSRYIPSLIAKFQDVFNTGNFCISKMLLATFEDERGSKREFPTSEKVLEILKNRDFYGLAPIRKKFFFEQLENSFHPKNWVNISEGNYTIEHIMPQTIDSKKGWPEMLGDSYEESYRDHLHLLGNLTVTAYNSELSNMSFEEKKRAYLAEERMQLTQDVLEEDVWNYEKIEQRTERLARKLISLWPRPTLSVDEVREYTLLRKKEDANEYISIRELLLSGVLQVDEKLVTLDSSMYSGAVCKVNKDGVLEFEDGKTDETPTGAARYAIKKLGKPEKSVNGWWFWFVPRLNRRLYEIKNLINTNS